MKVNLLQGTCTPTLTPMPEDFHLSDQMRFQAHERRRPARLNSAQDGRAPKAFQRTSSAGEGRNGYLSPMHQNHRGLPRRRYKVWTILHNFDCRASDGTTPASRFFRRAFPDLFETVFSHIEALPQPRRRKHQVALSH